MCVIGSNLDLKKINLVFMSRIPVEYRSEKATWMAGNTTRSICFIGLEEKGNNSKQMSMTTRHVAVM